MVDPENHRHTCVDCQSTWRCGRPGCPLRRHVGRLEHVSEVRRQTERGYSIRYHVDTDLKTTCEAMAGG